MKKNALKPQLRTCRGMPPEQRGACVAQREEVLELSQLPSNPHLPLVCMDAPPVQRIKETRQPLPTAPEQPEKGDDE